MNIKDRLTQFFVFLLLIGFCEAGASNLPTSENFQTSVEIHKKKSKKGPKRSSSFAGAASTWQWPQENEKNFKTIRHVEQKPTIPPASSIAKSDFESRIAFLKPIDEESSDAESEHEGPKNPFKRPQRHSSTRSVSSNHVQKSLITNMNHYPFETFDDKKNSALMRQTLSESKYKDRLDFYNNPSVSSQPNQNTPSSISRYSSSRINQSTGPLAREIRKENQDKAYSDSETNNWDYKKNEAADLNERISSYRIPKALEPKKFGTKINTEPQGNIQVKKPLNYYLVDHGKSWPKIYQFPDCKLTIY